MVVRIEPVKGPLRGVIPLPYSKSVSARQILIGLHRGGAFAIEGLSEADDTQKLIQVVLACGYEIERKGPVWNFSPGKLWLPRRVYVGEGGTTLRFILPWLATLAGETVVEMGGRLRERPLRPLIEALVEAGAQIEEKGGQLYIRGDPAWRPKGFRIDASQSGQFLSALLLMAPRLLPGAEVRETSGRPATLSYVEGLTLEILRRAGYYWECVGPGHWILVGGEGLASTPVYRGEADWSGGGYFWGWAMGAPAQFDLPLSVESPQPEKAFWMGGHWPLRVEGFAGGVRLASEGEIPAAWEGDIEGVPDVFPTLAVLGALAAKKWTFRGIRSLPNKESNRLSAMKAELAKVGAYLAWEGDRCWIEPFRSVPQEPLHFHAHRDHRVAMALSLLASRVHVPIYIHQAEVVEKSFPGYWKVLLQVGVSLKIDHA